MTEQIGRTHKRENDSFELIWKLSAAYLLLLSTATFVLTFVFYLWSSELYPMPLVTLTCLLSTLCFILYSWQGQFLMVFSIIGSLPVVWGLYAVSPEDLWKNWKTILFFLHLPIVAAVAVVYRHPHPYGLWTDGITAIMNWRPSALVLQRWACAISGFAFLIALTLFLKFMLLR